MCGLSLLVLITNVESKPKLKLGEKAPSSDIVITRLYIYLQYCVFPRQVSLVGLAFVTIKEPK